MYVVWYCNFILTLIGKSGRFTAHFAPYDTIWLSPLHLMTNGNCQLRSKQNKDLNKVFAEQPNKGIEALKV